MIHARRPPTMAAGLLAVALTGNGSTQVPLTAGHVTESSRNDSHAGADAFPSMGFAVSSFPLACLWNACPRVEPIQMLERLVWSSASP